MPIPRMTTRRWMIAVAILGVPLGLYCRQQSLEGLADHHEALAVVTVVPDMPTDELKRSNLKGAWHGMMAEKYRQAARYPWLPVPPDPPEPK